MYIENLPDYVCGSADDLQHALELGLSARKIGATKMNEQSSRSHTIFRVVVESRPIAADASAALPGTIMAELNLVDLAGSERVSLTGADGMRLREGAAINKSLLALSGVISKLSEGKHGAHIPYRDSKLTRILQNSLGGNTRTVIICNITPAAVFAEETISTLKFASRAKQILNTAVVNEILSDAALLQRYQQEIRQLQAENRRLEEGNSMREVVAERERLLREKDQIEQNFASLQQHASKMEKRLDLKTAEIDELKRVMAAHGQTIASPVARLESGRESLATAMDESATEDAAMDAAGPHPAQIEAPVAESKEDLRAALEAELQAAAAAAEVAEAALAERDAEIAEMRTKLEQAFHECTATRERTDHQVAAMREKMRELEEINAFREDECNAIVQDAEQRIAHMVTPGKVQTAREQVACACVCGA